MQQIDNLTFDSVASSLKFQLNTSTRGGPRQMVLRRVAPLICMDAIQLPQPSYRLSCRDARPEAEQAFSSFIPSELPYRLAPLRMPPSTCAEFMFHCKQYSVFVGNGI